MVPILARRILVLLWLLSGAAVTASAQVADSSPKAVPPPAQKPGPTPVALADVATAAGTVSQQLEQIKTEVSGSQISENVARELPILTQDIDARLTETYRTLSTGAPLDTMRDVEARWRKIAEQLAVWARDLTTGANAVDRQIAPVPDLRATWKATLDSAHSTAAPEEVIFRIDSVLKAIDSTEAALQERRAAILSLQARVAEQTQRVVNAEQSVKAAQSAAVTSLKFQDSPPIWSEDVRVAGQDLVARSQASFGAQVTQLHAYVAREWPKLLYFALILCAITAALIRVFAEIRQCVEIWTVEDPALARANRILELPFPTACVLTLLFCPLLFREAPRLFWVVLAAVALAPIVILVRRLIDRHLFPLLDAVVVFYFLGQLRALAVALPVLSRMILLVEMAGGIVFLLWFLHSTRSSRHGFASQETTHVAARLGIVLFLFIFATNALGFLGLANYLASGVLAAAYFVILFYAVARIMEGLIFFALQIRPLALLGVVQRHRQLLRRRMVRLVYVGAVVAWVLLTLDAFSLRRPVIEQGTAFINSEIAIRSLRFSPGAVLTFILAIWAAVLLSRFVRFILEEDIYGRFRLAPGSSYALSTILHYVILIAGFLAALAAVGVDMTKIAILTGGLGVGIGFGLQNIFNNFFSGLILLFERPVRVGDVIDVAGATGVVRRIGIRSSSIRLADNSVLIVPNSQLISEKVTDRTIPSRQARTELRVRVPYDSDPQQVIEVLTRAAASHPLVASMPAPEAFLKEFSADTMLFDLVCWTDDPARVLRVHSDVAVAVNAALRAAGLGMPQPKR